MAVLLLVGPVVGAGAQEHRSAAQLHGPSGPPPRSAQELGISDSVSFALVEASTGQVLAAREGSARRPIASAIKLVTALVVTAETPAGTLLRVGEEVRGVDGSSYGLRPGEFRTVEDLLAGLLLRSGNDAAVALAVAIAGTEDAFVDLMADRLRGLGIDARPGSASGLDERDALSPIELSTVARAALAEPRIREILGVSSFIVDGTEVENRNLFINDREDATGLKTGFTNAAGFTLAASARRDGRELIAIVLGASDDRERRSAASLLLDHGFEAMTPVRIQRTVSLRTTSGPVMFSAVGPTVTVLNGAAVEVQWPRALHPEERITLLPLTVDRVDAGTIAIERRDGRRAPLDPNLGRALADGVYSALRPVGLAGGSAAVLR